MINCHLNDNSQPVICCNPDSVYQVSLLIATLFTFSSLLCIGMIYCKKWHHVYLVFKCACSLLYNLPHGKWSMLEVEWIDKPQLGSKHLIYIKTYLLADDFFHSISFSCHASFFPFAFILFEIGSYCILRYLGTCYVASVDRNVVERLVWLESPNTQASIS